MSEQLAGDYIKRIFKQNLVEESIDAKRTVVFEVGSSVVRNLRDDSTRMVFPGAKEADGIVSLLQALGQLYECGHEMALHRLYPKVAFPVSRGTPMLSPHIRWEHSEDWYVAFYRPLDEMKSGERMISLLALKDNDWSFLTDHIIDGRNLFPATAYLNFVWETQSMIVGMMMSDMQIVFEDVKFLRATTISMDKRLELIVMVQRVSGRFEVIEGGAAVVTGYIRTPQNVARDMVPLPVPLNINDNSISLNEHDIYKELKLRGYHYR